MKHRTAWGLALQVALKPTALAGTIAVLAASLVMGIMVVPYGAWVGDNQVRAVMLPAALALVLLLILDKGRLFLLIILTRAALDPLLEATRIAPFLGLGAALNALVIGIALLYAIQRPRPALQVAVPMWAPLMIVVIYEAFKSPDPVAGLRAFLGYFSYAAVFLVPFYLKECRKDMRLCVCVVLLSSIVPAVYGFAELALATFLPGRVRGPFPHPNIFAFYLVLVMAVALYAAKSPSMAASWRMRLLYGSYIVVILVLLILTKTRSAYGAAAVVFLVHGLLFERRYLLYIGMACWATMLVPEFRDRVLEAYYGLSVVDSTTLLNSYDWRKVLWESAWMWMTPGGMILGYGLLSFPYYSVQFFPLAGGIQWGAHSVYVEWFFETGIVGVLCAAWLFFRLFALLAKGYARDQIGTVIVTTIVLAYLVFSYADNMLAYLAFNWYFWFALGTACAVAMEHGSNPEDQRRAAAHPTPGHPVGIAQ